MRKMIMILFLILITGANSFAANFTGQVVSDFDNQPIVGATIRLIGIDAGVVADENGRFKLSNIDSNSKLLISHVGFVSLSINVGSASESLLIKLTPAISVLDNIVVTANRYEKAAYKTTQPITAVSRVEIVSQGHTIVSDVIRDFPGLDMNDAGPFRARPVIRGLYGTRILVLVDGERLNDQRDISAFAGVSMSLVDVNEIERVEVVNGPASVLYGSDAMAGVINIITRPNNFSDKLTPFARYSGRYSTADEQHSNRVDVGFKSNRLTASFGFHHREANKDMRPPDGWNRDENFLMFNPEFYDSLNQATGRDFSNEGLANSRASIQNYDSRLGWKISDKYRLDADLGIFRGSDIGYPGVPNDSTPFWFFYPNHDRDNFSITLTGNAISERMVSIKTRISYQKISKDFLTDFLGMRIPAGPGIFISPLTSLTHTEVSKYGLSFQELYRVGQQNMITFGVDFLREEIDGNNVSSTLYEGMGPFPFVETEEKSPVPKNNWNELGIYSSGEIQLGKTTLVLGARFDNFWVATEETEGYVDDDDQMLPAINETYSAVNGSMGISHSIGRSVNLVANIGSAYRAPNVVERFYNGSASNRQTRPNPDIKPERSLSTDFGVKAVHERVNYSLMGFYSDYTDFTQLQNFDSTAGHGSYTPLWRYENIDDVEIYGFEGVIEANFENGLYGDLTFTYQHGQNKTNDQPLFVSPIKTSISVGYRHHSRGLFGEFNLRRIGDQDRVPDVTYLDDIATEGFTVVNFTTGIKLFDQTRLSISVKNLFDEIYSEPFNARNPDNPVPESGRNLIIGISSSI